MSSLQLIRADVPASSVFRVLYVHVNVASSRSQCRRPYQRKVCNAVVLPHFAQWRPQAAASRTSLADTQRCRDAPLTLLDGRDTV